MRVIAGMARRLPLSCPKGMDTRPTKDRIKETLFNILQIDIHNCVFVDLFSGSGAIGIEALSRGASKCYFIDKSRSAIECIRENLLFTKLEDNAIIIQQDAIDSLYSIHEKHVDIIFIDPPYLKGLELDVLNALLNFDFIDEHTSIIIEAENQTTLDNLEAGGYLIEREKVYKANKLIFLRKQSC
jgi:16S rRNA (guanine966-N2)-methyltransferase